MNSCRHQFAAMGCLNEIHIAAADQQRLQQAVQAAEREVLRIEARYSRYREDSLIGQINAAAGSGRFTPCDEEARWLLGFAGLLHQQSGGLFDISSGILRQAWNFQTPVLPAASQLQPLLERIGWQKVEQNESGIRLPEAGMELDFGGFAKEYATDRAVLALQQHGITHGYVNLGGDIRAIGPQPDGEPWLIGIADPRQSGQLIATIPLQRGALATSGDYEKFFDLDGRRYCHILNPLSGQPVACWRSVTVLAPLCIAAGATTTIAMLKESDGLHYLQDAGFPYLAVDAQGHILSNQPQ